MSHKQLGIRIDRYDNLIQPSLCRALHLTFAALAFAVLGVACGAKTNPPPIATVAPPDPVAPTSTVAPPAAVAPADAPASTFTFPPTHTVIPRADGDMTQAVLYNHAATLLKDGRVLVTGGQTVASSTLPPPGLTSADIYDPSTGRWSPTTPMLEPRRHHGAVLLDDGKVLVAGGLYR